MPQKLEVHLQVFKLLPAWTMGPEFMVEYSKMTGAHHHEGGQLLSCMTIHASIEGTRKSSGSLCSHYPAQKQHTGKMHSYRIGFWRQHRRGVGKLSGMSAMVGDRAPDKSYSGVPHSGQVVEIWNSSMSLRRLKAVWSGARNCAQASNIRKTLPGLLLVVHTSAQLELSFVYCGNVAILPNHEYDDVYREDSPLAAATSLDKLSPSWCSSLLFLAIISHQVTSRGHIKSHRGPWGAFRGDVGRGGAMVGLVHVSNVSRSLALPAPAHPELEVCDIASIINGLKYEFIHISSDEHEHGTWRAHGHPQGPPRPPPLWPPSDLTRSGYHAILGLRHLACDWLRLLMGTCEYNAMFFCGVKDVVARSSASGRRFSGGLALFMQWARPAAELATPKGCNVKLSLTLS
ncbi:hypothetical protein LXA43DRAFT_1064981 [Ganoderma leucocontextum]|nr:hypothetical protein LXA43DRAFT_1064981 [Ganoderma leucocontextum]